MERVKSSFCISFFLEEGGNGEGGSWGQAKSGRKEIRNKLNGFARGKAEGVVMCVCTCVFVC